MRFAKTRTLVWMTVAAILLIYYAVKLAPLPLVQTWWRAGEAHWNDTWHRRGRMADWLVMSHALIGKTRAQVVAQLGEPPSTDYFRDWTLVYNLGAERGFVSIDSEWLVLRIGADGRVQEVRILRD
jgi:hypothetical protein